MTSLFAKILVWFVITTAVTVIGLLVAVALTVTLSNEPYMPSAMMADMHLREAVHAWQTGGRARLQTTMDRVLSGSKMRWILTDAEGKNVLNGQDRSDLVERARRRPLLPIRMGPWLVISRQDPGQRYWYFLLVPRARWAMWFLHSRFLTVFGVAVLLCYLLATYLTTPVRRLQQAVERFGRGDMDARVRSDRKDELGDLARTFDNMADRIQSLMNSRQRLFQDISHELRSPLARLGVAAELARSDEQREEALAQIGKESDRLTQLIEELLRVTRAEGDPATLALESVDLATLINEIAGEAAMEAKPRDVSLDLKVDETISVAADIVLLRRAIENVLRNAIRHSPASGKVDISLKREGHRAVIGVRDFGPGVPEEALSSLFDPFFRVDEDRSREAGGVGLGLAIAQRAAQLHGGDIRARNASPGLEIEISLPTG